MRLFRRATLEELAAAGKRAPLVKAMAPRDRDFVRDLEGRDVDLGWQRRAEAARHAAGVDGDAVDDALAERLDDVAPSVKTAALASMVARPRQAESEMVRAVVGWEGEARDEGARLLVARADSDDAAAGRIIRAYAHQHAAVLPDEWVRLVFDAVRGPARREAVEQALARARTEPDEAGAARQVLTADEELGIAVMLDDLVRGEDRAPVVRLLGESRNAAATGPLVELLDSGDPRVRQAAAEALGRIQDPRAVEGLLQRTVDDDFAVRDAAQRALDALGTAGVVWSVAAAARGALDLALISLTGTEETRRRLEAPAAEA